MTDEPDALTRTLLDLARTPRKAHRVLFNHRHPNKTPPFHLEIIDLWHSGFARVLIQAFRGAAKSTLAEEAIIIQALLRQFKNGIILGETFDRAVERLRAIKHEFETNEKIERLFGNQVGATWSESKIVLANGVIIQAFGRGQSLRGSKHLDARPDRAFCDDIENEESVVSPEAIAKCMQWFMAVVIPALDPVAKIRINGTPLHPQSVLCQLAADPSWITRIYPIEHFSTRSGERVPTWPDRFDLSAIDAKRADYTRLGLLNHFAQEYMCQAEDPATKPFTSGLLRVEPTVRSWHTTYAMCDPARTVKSTSATTGMAVWSWFGNKLIVWDGWAGFWLPDQIVSELFKLDADYRPVLIGIERDGLEEFILQPLRHEQIKRGQAIPIRALKAPKGKIDFIKGLQPFFKAGEVVFAKELPQLREQLLGFPTGRIDIPNALAYALMLRPGQPVFDNFSHQHIVPEMGVSPWQPVWLALNADGRCTSAVLCQLVDGTLHVTHDWVREGEPGAYLADFVREASLDSGKRLRLLAPPTHFSQYDSIGLRAAVQQLPAQLTRGGEPKAGRAELRSMLGRLVHGRPALLVSDQARWTLNALSGGYAREVERKGLLSDEPTVGPYRVLMEGLESFAALARAPLLTEEDDNQLNYRFTPDGRRYISSRP